jgi:hypothetical protein
VLNGAAWKNEHWYVAFVDMVNSLFLANNMLMQFGVVIILKGAPNHHLPTSADVKKTWIYTSTPQYVFMA